MFLENVMMDTFISDEIVWRHLRELTDQVYAERDMIRRLGFRKARAEVFFGSMKDRYSPLCEESARRGLPAEWCGHPLQAIEQQFRENLRYALRSADRVYAAQKLAEEGQAPASD